MNDLKIRELALCYIEALLFAEGFDGEKASDNLKEKVYLLLEDYFKSESNVNLYESYCTEVSNGRGFAHNLYFGFNGHGVGFFDEVDDLALLEKLNKSMAAMKFYGDVYLSDDTGEVEPDIWTHLETIGANEL
ncbi:hypothetical protein [Alishewanella phage vB_AspM_Slicko01]|nr:hypothetical protein [Alishewanella phage vB_AspM_Slicko01]